MPTPPNSCVSRACLSLPLPAHRRPRPRLLPRLLLPPQLGKSKGGAGRDFLESLKAEGEAVEDVPHHHHAGAAGATAASALPLSDHPVFVAVEEKLTVVLNKDGGCENCEVQGSMSLQVGAEADACVRVNLAAGSNPGYQFKTHPNIDKAAYTWVLLLLLADVVLLGAGAGCCCCCLM